MKNARNGQAPQTNAVDRRNETGRGRTRGVKQIPAVVGPHCREHAVVLCKRLAHPHGMEQPGTERGQRRRVEIEVDEGAGSGPIMPTQQIGKRFALKMVKDPG